jgi:hypothetical protein
MVKSLKKKLNLKKGSTMRRNKSRKQSGGGATVIYFDNIKSRRGQTLKMYYGTPTDISNVINLEEGTKQIEYYSLSADPVDEISLNDQTKYVAINKPEMTEIPHPVLLKKFIELVS